MSLHLSPFDEPGKGTRSHHESPSRRIGVLLSILFLASLGTVATVTSTPAGAQDQGVIAAAR